MDFFKLLLILFPLFGSANNIYVKLGGSGTTRAMASDSATALPSLAVLNGITPSAGDSIKFKSGQTFFGQLTIVSSGNSTNKIVYTTFGGTDKAIITSMVTVSDWQPTGRPSIWISHTVINISSANMVVNTNTGLPIGMGRWPNYNMFSSSLTDGSDGGFAHYTTGSTSTKIIQSTSDFSLGHPPRVTGPYTTDLVGATINYKPEQFWDQYGLIQSWDSASKTINFTLKSVSNDPPNTDDPGQWGYCILDDSTLLDVPFEWYFNKVSQKIEVYSNSFPPPLQVATVTDLVLCRGKSWVVFENLEFNGARQDVMHFSTGGDVVVNNCNIFNGSRNNILDSLPRLTITNSNVFNGNSRNISIAPGGTDLTVRFSTIRNGGVLSGMGTSILEGGHACYSGDNIYMYGNVDGMTIEYNKISNAGYANIHKNKGNDVSIRHNFMDSACLLLADGGNMYSYNGSYLNSSGAKCSSCNSGATDTLYTQSYIVGNIITHPVGNQTGTSAGSAAGVGVAGIYNDKGSCCTIEDSNHVNGGEKSIFVSFGSINLSVRNNMVIDGLRQLQVNTRMKTGSTDVTQLNNIANNLLIARKNTQKVVWMESVNAYSLLKTMAKIDSNYLFRPVITSGTIDSMQIIHFISADASIPDDDITIKEDQTRFGFELHGIKTPTAYSSQLNFDTSTLVVYNPEFTNQVIPLPNKYDVYLSGVHLTSGSVLLKPTQWLYLIRTGELDPSTPVSTGPIIINRLNGHKVGP